MGLWGWVCSNWHPSLLYPRMPSIMLWFNSKTLSRLQCYALGFPSFQIYVLNESLFFGCIFVAVVFWDRASCGRTLCRLPSVKCPVPTTEPWVRQTKCYKPVGWALDQEYWSNIPKGILLTRVFIVVVVFFFWDETSTISSRLNKEG